MAFRRFAGEWRPYVSQGRRRANAARHAARVRKNGDSLQPIAITGRAIATSFWGKAWCDNLERYSDYGNRLPRGRTYVRNGSVIDLRIDGGVVRAQVSGSDIYEVEVRIAPLAQPRWRELVRACSGTIGSLLELLQGRFARDTMALLAQRDAGLFPAPKEITFTCSCPDYAAMCKHVAAVLYGVGARFDREPQLFFSLRAVDSSDLIAAAAGAQGLAVTAAATSGTLAGEDLGAVFGIALDATPSVPAIARPAASDAGRAAVMKADTQRKARRTKATKSAAPAVRRKGERKPARSAAAVAAAATDGFDEVFGPGLEVTEALLTGFGVDAAQIPRWVGSGVLRRTRRRGVYRTTGTTLRRVRAAYGRSMGLER